MSALFIVVAAILLLGPLIAIHEFGHYFVARKLGVKVLVYSIGFGPTILKWTSKKSGVQYQLSALPLGGYVKMLDEREENVAEADLPYAFNRQHPWKRIAIVAAGPLINLIFAILLFWLLFLPSQEQLNTRVGKVLADTPAATAQMQAGDKITAIDGTPVTTWEKLNFALVDRVGETGKILGVEKSPWVAMITSHGLAHAVGLNPVLEAAMRRIETRCGDALDVLKDMSAGAVDAVYLDPMFRYSVQGSSNMQPLHQIAERRPLRRELLQEACRVARRRVVVKEAVHSPEWERLGIQDFSGGRYSRVRYGILKGAGI